MRAIYWFRNDLRVYDNPALRAAAEAADEVLPVFVLDDLWMGKDQWGIRRMGPWRLQFLIESLSDLDRQLRKRGSALLFLKGKSTELLPKLASEWRSRLERLSP